jgi:hypothetical protein
MTLFSGGLELSKQKRHAVCLTGSFTLVYNSRYDFANDPAGNESHRALMQQSQNTSEQWH